MLRSVQFYEPESNTVNGSLCLLGCDAVILHRLVPSHLTPSKSHVSSCVRCFLHHSVYFIRRWHIPQASNWRRHHTQHLEYNTFSLLNTSFPECTPQWKHFCWLVSKALFLFMLHCIDIYTVIKNFIRYVLGFLEFCWATLLTLKTVN